MTDLRTAAQQALEAWDGGDVKWFANGYRVMDALRAALAEPAPPPEAQTEAEKIAYCAGWWDALAKAREGAMAESDTCTWQQDGDSDSGMYGTSCRRYFDLNDGTPEDNGMKWCCYCGKKLKQELITEDEDD